MDGRDNNQTFESKNEDNKEIDVYYEEDETKRRFPPFFLLILITTTGVLVALGLSFSVISYLDSNETINTIISNIKGNDNKDKYIITYVENTGGYRNGINLINQFPLSDSKGKILEGENYIYTFSILVGKKTKDAYYEITAVPNFNNTLNPNYVKLYLEKNGEGVDLSYRRNNKVKVFSEYKKSKYEGTKGSVIYQGHITSEDIKKGKIDFVMRMWIDEDVTWSDNYNNRTFAVRVNTYAAFLKGDKHD